MRKQQSGNIVCISSLSGIVSNPGGLAIKNREITRGQAPSLYLAGLLLPQNYPLREAFESSLDRS